MGGRKNGKRRRGEKRKEGRGKRQKLRSASICVILSCGEDKKKKKGGRKGKGE